jgi:hypothetical protein
LHGRSFAPVPIKTTTSALRDASIPKDLLFALTLLIADMFHPISGLAIGLFHNGKIWLGYFLKTSRATLTADIARGHPA